MDTIVDLLMWLVPALLVAGVVFFAFHFIFTRLIGQIVRPYFEENGKRAKMELEEKRRKALLPTQMQAYERLVLLLERINPESLVMRVHKPGINARNMHAAILKIIREEFDHNLTQQLYISNNAWEAVKAAREETVKLINIAAERAGNDAKPIELGQQIMELAARAHRLPSEVAVDILKKEFRELKA